MLKAVIFDMDGVIIDSEPMHARAALLAIQKYNQSITLDYLDQFIGTTTYHMCQKMINEFGLTITAEELLQANDDYKKELLLKEGHEIVPYVIDFIKDLHQNGMKLIIASSSPSAAIEEVLDTLKLRPYFQGFVSGNMVTHPKPAPDIFLLAAEQLGVMPSECVVIEDSYNGVTAAVAAGITSIGLINPNSGKQDLSKAAMLVEGFDEVDYNFVNKVYQYDHLEPVTILETPNCILRELSPQDAKALCDICSKPGIIEHINEYTGDCSLEAEKLEAYMKNIYHYYGFGLWGVFLKQREMASPFSYVKQDELVNQFICHEQREVASPFSYVKEDGCLIGRCGIELKMLDNEEIYELSYYLDPDYQGHGYATEFGGAVVMYCFDQLAVPKITAIIDKQNTKSICLAERLGMKENGNCIRNGISYRRFDLEK